MYPNNVEWCVNATITAKGNDTCVAVFLLAYEQVSLLKSVRVQDQNKYSIRSLHLIWTAFLLVIAGTLPV